MDAVIVKNKHQSITFNEYLFFLKMIFYINGRKIPSSNNDEPPDEDLNVLLLFMRLNYTTFYDYLLKAVEPLLVAYVNSLSSQKKTKPAAILYIDEGTCSHHILILKHLPFFFYETTKTFIIVYGKQRTKQFLDNHMALYFLFLANSTKLRVHSAAQKQSHGSADDEMENKQEIDAEINSYFSNDLSRLASVTNQQREANDCAYIRNHIQSSTSIITFESSMADDLNVFDKELNQFYNFPGAKSRNETLEILRRRQHYDGEILKILSEQINSVEFETKNSLLLALIALIHKSKDYYFFMQTLDPLVDLTKLTVPKINVKFNSDVSSNESAAEVGGLSHRLFSQHQNV
ncbi:hypothetical protein CCFV1_ORF014 [Cotesia congregata filamentous virus 1]|uniref:Uncharacterized protein n=1 Tax=Cotesia congregata filamentous virus 1 TaxID=3064291 RepID=A0ABC8QRZ6_9VIRU|nr:hypothetical protein CCFV1_ORF014 [Cotesia congregata filamentous virus 1]